MPQTVDLWVCQQCGARCERKRVRGQRPKWCSQKCVDLARRGAARTCRQCGKAFFGLGATYCTNVCANSSRKRCRDLVHVGPADFTWLPYRHPVMQMQTRTKAGPTKTWWVMFVSGPCAWCGESFTARSSSGAELYCSKRCSSRAGSHRRGEFVVPPRFRYAIYRRDNYECQICNEPIDVGADPLSDWYPSLDHIVPRSKGGGDEWDNLRTAHRWCNAVRGAEDYHSDLFEVA